MLDNLIKIAGYQLFRRDRINGIHGGVCLYIKDIIKGEVLSELQVEEIEVLWVPLRPKRLPRGFSKIISEALCHPPNADNKLMQDYLNNLLELFQSSYLNNAMFMAAWRLR